MKAQIITIGDELLIGQTIDTNSAWMGAEMSSIGFDIIRKISIHDLRNDILLTLSLVTGKSEVVLVTGGLGPTSDDITKQTICEFFGTKLVIDAEVLRMNSEMMQKRNFPMNENNRRQAEVPESCTVILNHAGTAPGMWFEKENTIFIFMPGVPSEMRHLMSSYVLPALNKRFTSQVIIHKNIMTYGAMEAKLAHTLEPFEASLPKHIKLAYLPSAGIIKLRLTAVGNDRKTLENEISEKVDYLKKLIPDLIFSFEDEQLESVIGKLLSASEKTLCTAESCTGGNIAHLITTIAGSSRYFRGSVVAYDNMVKTHILGVPSGIIEKHGAVSEEVVALMAEEARRLLKADFSVATSGIAGPVGGSPEKPVGTVCVAVSSRNGTITRKFVYGNDRLVNISRFSISALNLLLKQIINEQ